MNENKAAVGLKGSTVSEAKTRSDLMDGVLSISETHNLGVQN